MRAGSIIDSCYQMGRRQLSYSRPIWKHLLTFHTCILLVLKQILLGPVVAAAAYAWKDSSAREGTRLPGFDFDEALQASAEPKVSAAMLEKAEKVMSFLTCACKQVWDASQVPPGEQYSWNKIWRMCAEDPKRHVAAMQAEMDKLIAAGHMEWADLPEGMVAVPGVGVFRLKEHDFHGQGVLLKARMCFNCEQALGGGRPLQMLSQLRKF
jgi:hypothetical protein